MFKIQDDAMLIVESVATAANEAIADLRIVVHASAPSSGHSWTPVLATESWLVRPAHQRHRLATLNGFPVSTSQWRLTEAGVD